MENRASTLPNGLVAFGPQANCTLELCPLQASILKYQPSIPANAVFIAVFGLSLAAHAFQGVKSRTWGFAGSMISGCILEIIGYAGRVIIYDNPFSFNGFLMNIICITIAPVFFCAAIYVLLSQVIDRVDRSLSRFDPRILYWTFIPCDVVSLVLQATGGGLSCVGGNRAAIARGANISLGGLCFQVVTLVVFCGLFIDYVVNAARSTSQHRLTKNIRMFLAFLFLSTIFILTRCAYRIVELQKGYFSAMFRDENLFIGLESVVMCVAVLLLNAGHPAYAFGKEHSSKGRESPSESVANENNDDITMPKMTQAGNARE
ncbi:hypothetical protein G7046_g8849 [Stylonectria norvegica]|nr:hypothetical protein G7046_g8849 [Stylonectria norvegica]